MTFLKKGIFFCILLIISLVSCNFFSEVTDGEKDYDSNVTAVTFSNSIITLNTGESDLLKVSLKPSSDQGKCHVKWDYDPSMISCKVDNFGAVITGVKGGGTYIKASCNGIVATCLVSVISTGDDITQDPYIYSNEAVVELKPGDTQSVSVSLYGGTVADMEDFIWDIKDSSVAQINFARNNCIITAKKSGSTQLVCTHPKAEYSYTFVIYASQDPFKQTYITTTHNVLTINKNEEITKRLKVELVNPTKVGSENLFRWEYADEKSREVITLNSNYSDAEIIPLKNGIANIKVFHENAEYPLDIIVRVNTIVKNTYISLSPTTLTVIGSEESYTVYAQIENYSQFVNPEDFIWTVPENVSSLCDYAASGNSFRITGKKNGVFKVTVSHPVAEFSRSVLVILQDQIGSAIDASMYITTDENYVQTKVGDKETTLNVRLIGGVEGDQNDYIWTVDSLKKEGSNILINNGIVQVQYVDGTVTERSAIESGNVCSGKLVITPLATGTVNISVSHPKTLYACEITVRVFSQYALLTDPVTITTENSIIKMLNGTEQNVTATITNGGAGDENNITWTSSNSNAVTVSPITGATTVINAVSGAGTNQTYITSHLDSAIADKKILILSADTQTALDSMKAIYCDRSYWRVTAGEEQVIELSTVGLNVGTDRISWTTNNPNICLITGDSTSANVSKAILKGISAGETTVIASLAGAESTILTITVVPKGESADVIESPKYLTTRLNAIVLEEGNTANLNVVGVNIPSDKMTQTTWTMSDIEGGNNVFEMSSNADTATLTANKPGKTTITVANPLSSNSLKINAKCGELYEWTDNYLVYISTATDVLNLINGDIKEFVCTLINTSQTGVFSWSITRGNDVIDILGLNSGTCTITTKQAGQAVITVTNTLAGEISKEILVNVANSKNELTKLKYLTTETNVITVGEGSSASVAVDIANGTNILNGYEWASQDVGICDVIGSGKVASISGKKCGSTKITVRNNDECDFPLDIIVNVVNPIAAALDPYIACQNIVTCTIGAEKAIINAELIGGNESDNMLFTWNCISPSIAKVNASNNTAEITGLEEGITQVIVHHPKADVDRKILLVVEPRKTANCSISLEESIFKMTPTDEPRTITAALIGGEDNDSYDFKWWADSYDCINMNYTGAACVIEPIKSGMVTLHVSHPKAANTRDIVLYISNYSEFAFESLQTTVQTGGTAFVNMEVPATGTECYISYSSSLPSLCMAEGNSSVCILHPGNLPNGKDEATCTITATLLSKGGSFQGTAELLVLVQKKDDTKPGIALSGSTIRTLNKEQKINLTAYLTGKNIIDTTGAGIKWEITNANGEIAKFVLTGTNIAYGNNVQIQALTAGKTTVKLTHDECTSPLTMYLLVNGVNDPTISLNYQVLTMYIGEPVKTLTATITNDSGIEPVWSILPEDQDFFTCTTKECKAFISATKPGKAVISCSLPGYCETLCPVEIKETEKLEFFLYDKEDKRSNERQKYLTETMQIYPGEKRLLHYQTIPAKEEIKQFFLSDSKYCTYKDLGYISTYKDTITGLTYYYDDNVGTIEIYGKENSGAATLQGTGASLQVDSITINNDYHYLFTTDKSSVNATPQKVHDDPSLLKLNYQIRPACGKIKISIMGVNGDQTSATQLKLKSGTYSKYNANENSYVIDTHTISEITASDGIATGIIQFQLGENGTGGECNAKVRIEALNYNVLSSSGKEYEQIGAVDFDMRVFYQSHTFVTSILGQCPYINKNIYANNKYFSKYSRFDKATNSLIIGDGEFINAKVSVNEKYSTVPIESIKFVPNTQNKIKELVKDEEGFDNKSQSERLPLEGNIHTSSKNSINTANFSLYHNRDYGFFTYLNESNIKRYSSLFDLASYGDVATAQERAEQRAPYYFYRLSTFEDWVAENLNETLKTCPYVGNIEVRYFNFANGRYLTYQIPVYVEVRNCPCYQNINNYNMGN